MSTQPAVAGRALERATPTEAWLAEQTGVTIRDTSAGRVMELGADLRARVHMCIPAAQVVQVDPSYRPIPHLVRLSEAEHSYDERNAGRGKRALTAKALSLLASESGIQFLEPRVDHMGGAGVSFTARARRRGPDGTWEVRSATKTVRFAQFERKARRERRATLEKIAQDKQWAQRLLADDARLEEELGKHVDDRMDHVDQVTESKAIARVVRSWLAIPSTFDAGTINTKPFLTFSWAVTPDYANPHVAQIIAANFDVGQRQLYAVPEDEPRGALNAAGEVELGDDDGDPDDFVEGSATTEAKHTIHPETGEIVAPAGPDLADETAFDLDAGERPPRPEKGLTLRAGPYEGMGIDAALETPEGTAWVADRAIRMPVGEVRDLLVSWLSHSEGRPLGGGDLDAVLTAAKAAMQE